MERRLRRLEIRWRRTPEPRGGGEPFDIGRLGEVQQAELAALVSRCSISATGRPDFSALSDHELERMMWLSSIGHGAPRIEPTRSLGIIEAARAGWGCYAGGESS